MIRSAFAAAWLYLLAQPAAAQTSAVPTAGIGQMLLGLAAVIALVFALAWLARRLGVPMQNQSPLLRRIATLPLSARERVVIVEAGEQWLVLGVTAQHIQTLHTLPKGEMPQAAAINPLAGGFAALLKKARTQHAPQ